MGTARGVHRLHASLSRDAFVRSPRRPAGGPLEQMLRSGASSADTELQVDRQRAAPRGWNTARSGESSTRIGVVELAKRRAAAIGGTSGYVVDALHARRTLVRRVADVPSLVCGNARTTRYGIAGAHRVTRILGGTGLEERFAFSGAQGQRAVEPGHARGLEVRTCAHRRAQSPADAQTVRVEFGAEQAVVTIVEAGEAFSVDATGLALVRWIFEIGEQRAALGTSLPSAAHGMHFSPGPQPGSSSEHATTRPPPVVSLDPDAPVVVLAGHRKTPTQCITAPSPCRAALLIGHWCPTSSLFAPCPARR